MFLCLCVWKSLSFSLCVFFFFLYLCVFSKVSAIIYMKFSRVDSYINWLSRMSTLVGNALEIHSRRSVLYANCCLHEILMSQLAAECQQRASFIVIQHTRVVNSVASWLLRIEFIQDSMCCTGVEVCFFLCVKLCRIQSVAQVLKYFALCCCGSQCAAVCCRELQSAAECCSVLQRWVRADFRPPSPATAST